jgi:hypothetical protein
MIYIILFTIKYLLIIVLVNIYLEFQISLLLTKSRYLQRIKTSALRYPLACANKLSSPHRSKRILTGSLLRRGIYSNIAPNWFYR